VPSRRVSRRRPWKERGILERVLRNLPAYVARNVEKVAAGTGEALRGPAVCEFAVGVAHWEQVRRQVEAGTPITDSQGRPMGRPESYVLVPLDDLHFDDAEVAG
jgi:ABC-type tungstate transport system permease subunit